MRYAVLKSNPRIARIISDESEVNPETEDFSAQAWAVRDDGLGYFVIDSPDSCPVGYHAEYKYPNGTVEMQERRKADGRDNEMSNFKPMKNDLANKLARIAIKSIGDGVAVGQPLVMTTLAREALDKLQQIEGIPQLPTVKAAKASGTPENMRAVLKAEYGAIVATSSTALQAAVKYASNGE